MCPRKSVKEFVLDAAEEVATEKGALHLTIEEVALKAGLTKAGVIYHFKSKERLLSAMLERLVADCEERMSSPCDEVARLKVMIDKVASETAARRSLCGSLLAGAATSPKLLSPVKAAYLRANHRRELDSSDFELSTILFLAADGLWLQETLGLSPLSKKQRQKVLARLHSMAEEMSVPQKRVSKKKIKKK